MKNLRREGLYPGNKYQTPAKIFAREYRLPDPEAEYNEIVNENDIDRPEEGYNAERDVEDDQAAIVNGVEQQVDYGDYGDRREELADRDYERNY